MKNAFRITALSPNISGSSSSKFIANQFQNKGKNFKRNFLPCKHCNKIGIHHSSARRDMIQGVANTINLNMKELFA
jgi:ribosomal protein L9